MSEPLRVPSEHAEIVAQAIARVLAGRVVVLECSEQAEATIMQALDRAGSGMTNIRIIDLTDEEREKSVRPAVAGQLFRFLVRWSRPKK